MLNPAVETFKPKIGLKGKVLIIASVFLWIWLFYFMMIKAMAINPWFPIVFLVPIPFPLLVAGYYYGILAIRYDFSVDSITLKSGILKSKIDFADITQITQENLVRPCLAGGIVGLKWPGGLINCGKLGYVRLYTAGGLKDAVLIKTGSESFAVTPQFQDRFIELLKYKISERARITSAIASPDPTDKNN